MYPVSQKFLDALTGPHIATRRMDASQGTTLLMGRIPIVDGSVTVDRGSKTRRTLTVTVSDIALMPRQYDDPLAPFGQTLQVWRGVQFQDGTEELAPVGVFRIQAPQGDRDLGPVTVTGLSLEAVVADEPFLAPFSSTAHGTCAGAITALINAALPDAVVTNLAAVDPVPASRVWDVTSTGTRWDAVLELASAMGAECYADAEGNFVIRDLPDLATATPVWDVAAGQGGAMVSATEGMDRSRIKNGWRVTGGNMSGASPPVSYLAVDADPASPTRWGGPLGHQLGTSESSLLTTVGQCQVVAEALLRDSLGATGAVALQAVPNPALEAGDCIRVRYADGYAELHIVQSLTLPLTAAGAFPITTYSRQEAS